MPSALEDDLVSGGDEKRNYDGPATLEVSRCFLFLYNKLDYFRER